MLPLKKIYIDSRHRTADSVSSSNFKIELPYSLTFPENTAFFITDICIPHVFRLIERDANDRIYFTYTAPGAGGVINIFYTYGVLSPGGYSGENLASAIQAAMNANVEPGFNISFSVSWDSASFSLSASCSGTGTSFKFLTDAEVVSKQIRNMYGKSLDPANLKSANDILKIDTPTRFYNAGETFNTDFVRLQPISNIYITSPNFGSFDTLSSFSNNVVKKVPVNVPYGFMIIDQNIAYNDFLNCSKQTLRTIEFHLKDSRGEYINMHGMNVSFAIIFHKFNFDY